MCIYMYVYIGVNPRLPQSVRVHHMYTNIQYMSSYLAYLARVHPLTLGRASSVCAIGVRLGVRVHP